MNFASAFTPEKLQEAWNCLLNEFPFAMWETLYSTLLATFFAIVIGLPLGVLLVTGEAKGIRPLPGPVMNFLNVLINLLRSVPFIILMVMIIPLTRVIVGTSVGTVASIVPLTVAAFPFIARLVESSLREVNPNIIEAAQSMGASTWQIVTRVMLPERAEPDYQFHAGNYHNHGIYSNVRCRRRRRAGQAGSVLRVSAVPFCGAVPGGYRAGDYYPGDSVLRNLAGTEERQAPEGKVKGKRVPRDSFLHSEQG